MENKTAEQRLEELGLVLPPAPQPLGVYKPCLVEGNYAYVSGHGPLQEDGSFIVGRVGYNMDQEIAKMAARQVGLAILATLKATLGSLDRVEQVVKVLGMVAAESHFEAHLFVINGCSELFAQVWGPDKGVGVRSAIGVASLPGNIPVEIEAMFRLRADV